jgi:hypothetical protein
MKIYRSKRDSLITILIIVFILLPIIIFFLDIKNLLENPLPLLVLFLPVILLLWIYFDTYYVIDGQKLKYHSAFIKGEIEINKIREIVKGQTIWVGIKPALSRKGLIIKFNIFDEIYISPKSNDMMISDLIEINPDINLI